MIRFRPAVVIFVAVLAGCTATPTKAPQTPPTAAGPAGTGAVRKCANVAGFSCSTLAVPVDRAKPARTLQLNVAVADNKDAPKGVLVLLTGGPGQPGVALLPKVRQRIEYLLRDYRLVMFDQRGTGGTALKCPKLQREVGSSDITAASADAVKECAGIIGPDIARYTTADTVADLEDLRIWLGVERWTLDGISYGSYVAQRYAYAHPDRVAKMVLDSVVPADGVPALYEDSLHRSAEVLRDACTQNKCDGDPAADVAKIVADRHNGVELFDFLVTATIAEASFAGRSYYPVLDLIHKAANGDAQPLEDAMADLRKGSDPGAEIYSSGLHMATLCPELAEPPWGRPDAPLPRDGIVKALQQGLNKDAVWPFDPATAFGQGLVGSCQYWPPVPPPAPVQGRLDMPVLLLNGDRDLSTPLPWAQDSARAYAHGTLVVVPEMGHSVQGRNAKGDAAVKSFLLG
jgi:pimeloyl-ACP methyl ester carboxylesterase